MTEAIILLTIDLEQQLKKHGDFDEDMVLNEAPPELADVLNRFIDDRKMKKSDVIRMLNVDRNYGYQVLNGKRTPTRNFIIQTSLILKLSIDEMNYLLQLAGKSPLYVRNLVDARVFYAINHRMDYYDAVDFIWYSDAE
ncbi:MAG: hypothetical protein ACI4KA_03395 [Oscillospiraceae bacterium]